MDPTVLYEAWIQAEKPDPKATHANSDEMVKSKLAEAGVGAQLAPSILDSVITQRRRDLENETQYGPLRLFPEDQWLEILEGPGIDGPNSTFKRLSYTKETIRSAHDHISWAHFPTEDRQPESFFVYGEGQVLLPRATSLQPVEVVNPFRQASHLPLPAPAIITPQKAPERIITKPPVNNPQQTRSARPVSMGPQPHSNRSTPIDAPATSSTGTKADPRYPSSAQSSNHMESLSRNQSNRSTPISSSPTSPQPFKNAQNVDNAVEYGYFEKTRQQNEEETTSDEGPARCPDEINGYCRSWNIAHQKICNYSHLYWSEKYDPTGLSSKQAKYSLKKLTPGSPEFDYISIRFSNSWIHQRKKPTVTKIKQVSCPVIEKLFNQMQDKITAKGIKPNVTELYHGTCEANFQTLFTQGFQPPADYAPHPQCAVSGPYADKLTTSLCKRTCKLCTTMPKHSWSVCHMWGLGIYCAIDSSKSDLYVSNKKGKKTDKTKRKMLLCSVILGEAETVKQLKKPDEMHDRVTPVAGKNSIFAVGFKNQAIPTYNGQTLGVIHDEYVVFHPHQIMPLYIIEYSK